MKQGNEPSLLVKTVRCSVSENNCRHPFWSRFNVSIICTLCIDVPERNRLFVELGHMLEYHLATAHWMASHSSVHSGPHHTYPDFLWISNYFFPDSKISTSARTHFQIEFACPLAGKTKFKQCGFPARRRLFLCEELCLVTVLLWHSKTSVICRGIYCSLRPGLFDFGGFLFVARLLFLFWN